MSESSSGLNPKIFLSRLEWRQNIIYVGFVAVFLFFLILLGDSGFASPNNILNIFRQTATISIMAVAMTYVIAAAEIDLSVGSVAGLAAVVAAMALNNYGLVVGVLAGLAVGVASGSLRKLGRLFKGSLLPGNTWYVGNAGGDSQMDY